MRKKKIKGLGDAVKAVTDFVGIVPCEACLKRQEKWNKIFPFTKQPREFTEKEIVAWRKFSKPVKTRLTDEERKFVCRTYADIFKQIYFEPCINCSPAPIVFMIEQLNDAFKAYDEKE